MLRLTKKKDYNRLRDVSQKVVGKYFIVVYIYDETVSMSVAGITVSKRVGNAVTRNKVKRRIKAYLRDCTTPPAHYLCNIIALCTVVNADWLSFKKDLDNCLERVNSKRHSKPNIEGRA